jgi:hypothetical protein
MDPHVDPKKITTGTCTGERQDSDLSNFHAIIENASHDPGKGLVVTSFWAMAVVSLWYLWCCFTEFML